ncbi:concanavalin A-like lectin/glucanase domain-containing protein [Gorgonomyces haynaldii]|nr:concanavalin A-like lectin/glucanase domain-containing protein [Gorgonomyces haynaldii]
MATKQFGVSAEPNRLDYKQTFKYPIYAGKREIPYFNVSGNAIISREYVRLTSSVPYQQSILRCSKENDYKEWMVEFSFSIYGKASLGGDGMVFWYLNDFSSERDFYGGSSVFKGLAVVFDTSDADKNRFSPFVYAIENNGHPKDLSDYTNQNLGSCYREYRNTPAPVYAKITYSNNVLSLDMDTRQGGQSYTNCFQVKNVHLPTGYRFGLSSSTDERGPDDHDVYSFEVYELNPIKREHKLRPHEKEDIAAGKAFKMEESYKQEIKKVEEIVQSTETKQEIPILDAQSIVKIEENQWRIIEALNLIEQKMGQPQTQHVGQDTRLTDKMDQFGREISDIKQQIDDLKRIASDLDRTTQTLMDSLGRKMQQSHEMITESIHMNNEWSTKHQSQLSTVFYGFAFLGVLLIAYVGMTIYRSRKQQERKKFI